MLVRGMDLPPPPMRLAYASEGAASEATVRVITVAVVRKEVLTDFPKVKIDKSGEGRVPRQGCQSRLAIFLTQSKISLSHDLCLRLP